MRGALRRATSGAGALVGRRLASFARLTAAWRAFREPVARETRQRLARLWSELPEGLRLSRQMIGRHAEGCGATIGVQPRCDFACSGCYLGDEANRVRPAPLREVRSQLAALRRSLGLQGNVQITDGEVTLCDPEELIQIVRAARELGLMPMLMTHGETLRRDPGLLERLIVEGGLREISFHVDSTQRGRRDRRYSRARGEEALHPLRAEFAGLLRSVRRRTRLPLRAASTVTVTRANLTDVSSVARWFLEQAPSFRVLSFLPAAQVGRTRGGLGGRVDVDELWDAIATGLLGDASRRSELDAGRLVFGHPDCSRVVLGLAVHERGKPARYLTLRPADHPSLARIVDEFLDLHGGVQFRADDRWTAFARTMGLITRDPLWFLARAPRFARAWLERLDPGRPLRAAWKLASGHMRLHCLAVLSHHFMSAAELGTARGKERESACVFRVPVGGELISMCAVNALGIRERYYASLGPASGSADESQGSGSARRTTSSQFLSSPPVFSPTDRPCASHPS